MLEQEVWGELTKEQYDSFIETFTKQFGEPELKKRLSISFWDPAVDKDLDTRVRITSSGKGVTSEIMQKKGEWENQLEF